MPKKPLQPPHILACHAKACSWQREFDFYSEERLTGWRCPECGTAAVVRCGANKRRNRGRCMAAVHPGERCKKHGRHSPKGAQSGTFETGSTSRYVPGRYRETYHRGLDDPLVQRQQKHQLAMLAGLEDEAARRLDSTESGEAWDILQGHGKSLVRQLREIDLAADEGEVQRGRDLTARLLRFLHDDLVPVIRDGAGEEAARRELVKLFRDRARILRVQQQGEQTVPIEVLSVLQARFVAFMSKYVQDQSAFARMVAELREEMVPGWEQAREMVAAEGNGSGPVIDVVPN